MLSSSLHLNSHPPLFCVPFLLSCSLHIFSASFLSILFPLNLSLLFSSSPQFFTPSLFPFLLSFPLLPFFPFYLSSFLSSFLFLPPLFSSLISYPFTFPFPFHFSFPLSSSYSSASIWWPLLPGDRFTKWELAAEIWKQQDRHKAEGCDCCLEISKKLPRIFGVRPLLAHAHAHAHAHNLNPCFPYVRQQTGNGWYISVDWNYIITRGGLNCRDLVCNFSGPSKGAASLLRLQIYFAGGDDELSLFILMCRWGNAAATGTFTNTTINIATRHSVNLLLCGKNIISNSYLWTQTLEGYKHISSFSCKHD